MDKFGIRDSTGTWLIGFFVTYPCRAGAIIKEIREASGAHIKILPAEDLPPCGLSNDRVVQ